MYELKILYKKAGRGVYSIDFPVHTSVIALRQMKSTSCAYK